VACGGCWQYDAKTLLECVCRNAKTLQRMLVSKGNGGGAKMPVLSKKKNDTQ